MMSFDVSRQNLKIMERKNKEMKILDNIEWDARTPRPTFDSCQKWSVGAFLRIINFVLTQYSPELYEKILDRCPTIKSKNDKEFIEQALIISRDLLDMKVPLEAKKFLEEKWVDLKMKFLADLCKNVDENWSKTSKKDRMMGNKKQPSRNIPQNFNDDIEDDEEEQIFSRKLNVQPTMIDESKFQSAFDKNKFSNNHNKFASNQAGMKKSQQNYLEGKQTVSLSRGKANVFPKTMKNPFPEDEDDQQDENQFLNMQKRKAVVINHNSPKKAEIVSPKKEEGGEYATKQEMNQLVNMVLMVNSTITNLVGKFGALQNNVTTQINELSARVSLLEQTTKIIKNNL